MTEKGSGGDTGLARGSGLSEPLTQVEGGHRSLRDQLHGKPSLKACAPIDMVAPELAVRFRLNDFCYSQERGNHVVNEITPAPEPTLAPLDRRQVHCCLDG